MLKALFCTNEIHMSQNVALQLTHTHTHIHTCKYNRSIVQCIPSAGLYHTQCCLCVCPSFKALNNKINDTKICTKNIHFYHQFCSYQHALNKFTLKISIIISKYFYFTIHPNMNFFTFKRYLYIFC